MNRWRAEKLPSGVVLSSPILSGPFPVWVTAWVREIPAKRK